MKIITKEVMTQEWLDKVKYNPNDWLELQYEGLTKLVDHLNQEMETKMEILEKEAGDELVSESSLKQHIYPLEDLILDLDTQLVTIEDEMVKRGLCELVE